MVQHPTIPMHMGMLSSTNSASAYNTWLAHAIITAFSETGNCGSSVLVDVSRRRHHSCSVPTLNQNCLEILGSYFLLSRKRSRRKRATYQHQVLMDYSGTAWSAYPFS